MIQIKDKAECVGCWACVNRCPKRCISMEGDDQGFLYPKVDLSMCIECGLCKKVCPVIHQGEGREPHACYGAKNKNAEVQLTSSSGGAFTALAEKVIEEGGVVFGAKFDKDWLVIHDYTDTREGLIDFRGSKYVQSKIGDTFKKCQEFLKQGRRVLFSGTPCQIAGLRRCLGKDYPNLLTVDIICHGVPSPAVWKDYFGTIKDKSQIARINFRDKRNGWRKYGLSVGSHPQAESSEGEFYQLASQNEYIQGFIQNYFLRPSCHKCPAKEGKSGSDITLADYWGVNKIDSKFYDKRGVSLIMVNTPKGQKIIEETDTMDCQLVDFSQFLPYNISWKKIAARNPKAETFWKEYSQRGLSEIPKPGNQSIFKRIRRRIERIIKRG